MHFINRSEQTSEDERRRDALAIRTYINRLNGERRRCARARERALALSDSKRIKSLLPNGANIQHGHCNLCCRARQRDELDGEEDTNHECRTLAMLHPTKHNHRQHLLMPAALPYTLSPTFGAFADPAFDSCESTNAADIAGYVFGFLESTVWSSEFLSARIAQFCTSELIFSAYTYYGLLLRDLVRGPLTLECRRRKLAHRSKATQLLNELLVDLRDEDIELVITAMQLMLQDKDDFPNQDPLQRSDQLFIPHPPFSELFAAVRVGQIDNFLPAVSTMATRIGGLENFKDPHLHRVVRFFALQQAARNFTYPVYPPSFIARPSQLQECFGGTFDITAITSSAFQSQVPGGLPQHMLEVMADLRAIDFILAQNRYRMMTPDELQHTVVLRASIQYRLLSLLPWVDLSDFEKAGHHPVLYECCRLTAILYLNTVIQPTLTSSKGISEPLRLLREQLELASFLTWDVDVAAIHLWFLVIGGIGGYRSSHRNFYVSALEAAVRKYKIGTLRHLVEMVRGFVWSDYTCEQGAAVLWDAAQLQCILRL